MIRNDRLSPLDQVSAVAIASLSFRFKGERDVERRVKNI
jgi:hypothetical protein